eukprot:gene16009-16177_t
MSPKKKPSKFSSLPKRPVVAVGVVCLRHPGEVLLIRRSKPPNAGAYSLPGGKLEFAETLAAAALRELAEETGVSAELLGLIDVVDGLFDRAPDGQPSMHYVLVDYAARWTGGTPTAGDDAAEAMFVSLDRLSEYRLWSETERIIRQAAARWPDAVAPKSR